MMYFQNAVKLRVKLLLTLFALTGCNASISPDDTITSVASPNNFILYEKTTTEFSSQPLKIQSDVPVTIQRYDDMNESLEADPINAGDGIILVTSNCDTEGTTVVPTVSVEQGEDGAILVSVNVDLDDDADDASQMPFLQSSTYNASWFEYGCGFFTEEDLDAQELLLIQEPTTTSPTKKPTTKKPTTSPTKNTAIDPGGAVEPTVCLEESDCDAMRQKMGIASFQVGEDYQTKGCFSKKKQNGDDIAYWGSGGSLDDKLETSLPGIRERILCEKEVDLPGGNPSGGPVEDSACTSQEKCNQMRLEMGISSFQVGDYPTKGCFSKNGANGVVAYWGRGGSSDEMSSSNVGGIRERLWCKESSAAVDETEEDAACLTENECDEQRQEMGIAIFYSGTYPTKGCFMKNGQVFYSEGSLAEKSTANLSGNQERVWCKGSSVVNAALQKANINAATQVRHESVTSSAVSLKSFMLGSLLYNAVSSQAAIAPSSQSRALDTCTYNVEILLSGCTGSGTPIQIEVAAPKARVINSVIEDFESETEAVRESFKLDDGTQLYNKEFKHTAMLTFPSDAAELIVIDGNFADVPLISEDKCLPIVCGRPFVDSEGHSLLASPFSAEECGDTSSWLGEVSMNDSGKAMETQASSPIINKNQLILGGEWTNNALGEHASIASFAAFSIALMTNHAPSNLVEDSLKAALDEVRHAKTSFDIASKLMGKLVGPGPLPPSSHEFNHDLTTLAMSVAKEGCVDETLSALAAAAEVELIDEVLTNGVAEGNKYLDIDSELLVWIRNELHTISMDESNHSALAWRTLDWVCSVDHGACESVKQSVLDESNLIAAFQRRFGSIFKDTPEVLDRMMVAWANIYTNQNIQSTHNATANDVGGYAERSGDATPNPSLISLLVENISHGGSYS